nr:Gag protease polyprotein [Tanacetum cinerariifolium]
MQHGKVIAYASRQLKPYEHGYWASLRIEPDLISRIKEAQKEDSEIWTIVENLDKQRRHDAIWVVVDRLTKSAHFLPIRKDYSVSRLAETFQQEIVRLHGTPTTIVSDRDPCFTLRFWKGLQKAWGTRLKFSTAFHPQTDGNAVLRFVGIRLENVLSKDRR